MHYNYHQIRKFTLGAVVADTAVDTVTSDGGAEVGHVVGFGLNAYKEVVVEVKFASTGVRMVHPVNLTILS